MFFSTMHPTAHQRLMTTGHWLLAALMIGVGGVLVALWLLGVISALRGGGIFMSFLVVLYVVGFLVHLAKDLGRAWRVNREHTTWLAAENERDGMLRKARKRLLGVGR
ncbi:MAG: hypothetical protein Q8L23_03380 [Caulobacter sp.]|nr:hypothetical protein [Caulobacter sp.]